MVGAGGIGVILLDVIRGFDYPATSALLIIIIAAVTSTTSSPRASGGGRHLNRRPPCPH